MQRTLVAIILDFKANAKVRSWVGFAKPVFVWIHEWSFKRRRRVVSGFSGEGLWLCCNHLHAEQGWLPTACCSSLDQDHSPRLNINAHCSILTTSYPQILWLASHSLLPTSCFPLLDSHVLLPPSHFLIHTSCFRIPTPALPLPPSNCPHPQPLLPSNFSLLTSNF